jgi:ComF family protein
VLAEAWRYLTEAAFPARCIGCQRRGVALCAECRDDLPYLPGGVCRRCALPATAGGVCKGCRRLTSSINAVHAPFSYQAAARTAVLTLKFRTGRYLVPLMGELLRDELERRPLHVEVVAPVPLSAWRRRVRGFNQAALLAEAVAPALRAELMPEVISRRERAAQSTLGAADRLRNLAGAFSCRQPTAIRGKHVLLVDDVVTTGATVSACADTLAEAGARRITVLAFARDL